MDYLIERMRAAGCTDIRVVTRPEKLDVVENARGQGARIVQGHPPTLAASIRMGLTGLADHDVALLGFPDTVWEPLDGYRTLLAALERGWDAALGLFPVEDPETCDVVVRDEHDRVLSIELRPKAPASNLIWGCAAVGVHHLRAEDEALDPGAVLGELARTGRVIGIRLSERFVDIGKSRAALLGQSEQAPPSAGDRP